MEQFFIIPDNTKAYDEYRAWKANGRYINEVVKEFRQEHQIESSLYRPTSSVFYIIPSALDLQRFANQFTTPIYDQGLRQFKKNSPVGKAWSSLQLKVLNKPIVPFWFERALGKTWTRLVEIDNVLYCSIDSNIDEILKPKEYFIPIKTSEFWLVVENKEVE